MKNTRNQKVIDLDNPYVRDLGANLEFGMPQIKKQPVWGLILVVVLALLATWTIGWFMTRQKCQVQMTVTLNNTVLKEDKTYSVRAGDVILITAESSESTINKIGYYTNLNTQIRDSYKNSISITVPEKESGTRIQFFVEAVADNDDGTPNTITKTGWRKFIFLY